MIPKTVHSFWFGGGTMPPLARTCIDSWRRALPDYTFKHWDESKYDCEAADYTRSAYRSKRYAFVSDYARLDVLRTYGGIYLDVDVEVRKSFTPLLGHGAFLGFMYDCNLGTAVIGARAGHPLLTQLLERYGTSANMSGPNNDVFTRHFLSTYPNFRLDNSGQQFGDISIYPKEYFEFPTLFGTGAYSVHHFMGSWWRSDSYAERFKQLAKQFGGRPGYWMLRTMTHCRALRHSPFRERYLLDRRMAGQRGKSAAATPPGHQVPRG